MDKRIPRLIVFAGLPGVGKTTLAKCLAEASNTVYLRIDTIEQAILRSTLKISSAEDAGYEAAYNVAKDNLYLGHDVVADSVNPIEITRHAWEMVAQQCNVPFFQVEVICSDITEHRTRVQNRRADIKNHSMPTWADVQNRDYDEWTTDRIVIDTADRSIDDAYCELRERMNLLA